MTKQPNIVFILTDDQGYGDLACHGNPILETPNIDALYEKSAHFTNFHVGPTCAPSRAGLLTGHYANSTGVWHTVGGRSLLRKDEWTLAQALGENGYATGIFGKWHLGDAPPYRPQERGFQTAIVHGGGGISQVPDYWGNDYFDDTYWVNGVPQQFSGYCTDVFTEEAQKFIKEKKGQPFFCYLSYNAPHTPLNVEEKYVEPYRGLCPENRARFYGMIANIDENVGKMWVFLEEEGILEDTIFIFMTDNGTAGGFQKGKDGFLKEGFNAGMRGSKGSEYDGGHRVPFFLHYAKGNIKTAQDIDEITANVDFMPTLLDLCGVSTDRTFHGKSLVPLLEGESFPDRVIVTDSQRLTTPIKWRSSAVCTKEYRLINGKELYHIPTDGEQRVDIAQNYPDLVEKLRGEYEHWWDLVSVKFGEEIPISIGKQETVLTCHDAISHRGAAVWQQAHIREGMLSFGRYEILVEETGKYRFQLRRWPREQDVEITSTIPKEKEIHFREDAILENDYRYYRGGVALPFHSASLVVGNQYASTSIGAEDKYVEFTMDLHEGNTMLEANFIGQENADCVSPYYIYVLKI